MKFLSLTFLASLFLFAHTLTAQVCPVLNYTLNSQTAVDNFAANNNNCDQIQASLFLAGGGADPITDLSPLDHIKSIGGVFNFQNMGSLSVLDAFPNLETIGAELRITSTGNTALTEIKGFNKLKTIRGKLGISDQPNLETIGGFPVLESVGENPSSALIGGNFEIKDNPKLATLSGFLNLDVAGRDFIIQNNPFLPTVAFNNLKEIGKSLIFKDMGGVATLSGFVNLEEVKERIFLNTNSNLTTISGFQNLEKVNILEINGNSDLTSMSSFLSLDSVFEDLIVKQNGALPGVGDFPSLAMVGGKLEVRSNGNLTMINGFATLDSIGTFSVFSNQKLASITGFGAATKVGTIDISNSNQLATLDAFATLPHIGSLIVEGLLILSEIQGFDGLQSADLVQLKNDFALSSLSGLSSLQTVNVLNLTDLDFLLDFDELQNLSGTIDQLIITKNLQVDSLDGFSGITDITSSLTVTDNANLSGCCPILNWLANTSPSTSISGNAPGCLNVPDIEIACCSLPDGFVSMDIGNVGSTEGTACLKQGGGYTFDNAGTGIGGTADGFHYLYIPQSGDVDLIVRVTGIHNNTARKAGIMLRESLDDDAANVSLLVNGKKMSFLSNRSTAGATTTTVATKSTRRRLNSWLRLSRAGNNVLAYYSRNGVSWEYVGFTTFSAAGSYFVGIAATKGAGGGTKTFEFDNFSIDAVPYRLANVGGMGMTVDAYPNPFDQQLLIRVAANTVVETFHETSLQWRILNQLGQLVKEETVTFDANGHYEGQIATDDLPAGMYYLHVRVGEVTEVQKLVKR